jgi:hypothetical protein
MTHSTQNCASITALIILLMSALPVFGGDDNHDLNPAIDRQLPSAAPEAPSVQWHSLLKQSLFFLSVQQTFRGAADADTRNNLGGKFFGGYWSSVSNLHGWSDGDPFLINYVGHPMQGAIAGDIWIHNDPRFRNAEFGLNKQYWTSKLRAMAFAWAYSEQFEIGPVSEASVGHIQSQFPQQGFVDHVITPTAGMGWMVAEDALDRYLIRRIEDRTGRRWIRILARGILNPARSFANCMELDLPWNREPRLLPTVSYPAIKTRPRKQIVRNGAGESSVPFFEFALRFNQTGLAPGQNRTCVGGGGSATFNLSPGLGIETDVSGCKTLGMAANQSGDMTTFMAGPKLSRQNVTQWTPWVHLLVGGEKITKETYSPDQKTAAVIAEAGSPRAAHHLYTRTLSTTGFAMALGGGLDWMLNRSVLFRVGNVDYVRRWMMSDPEIRPNEVRVSMGVVLRLGG